MPGFILFLTHIRTKDNTLPLKRLKEPPLLSGEDYFFSQLSNGQKTKRTYESLKFFLPNISIIINDDSYCSDIINYTYTETNMEVNCSYYVNNFTNDTTHVIKIEKIEDRFKIFLIERQREDDTPLMFNKTDLDQDKITDLFYLNNLTHNGTNYNNFEEKRFKIFWELESFLAKLLIILNKKKVNSDFKMNLGFNSYPEHYQFSDINTYSTYSLLSFVIALQFSIIGYNFNMRMIDEKENKLFILLERQGISKFKYFLSWLFTYYSLFLFSIFSFTKYIFLSIHFRYILTIINMLLFSLSIFAACVFFTTCIKSTKTGTTAVKFFNFGSILLGFVVVLAKTAKKTKLFFSLIPQINLYLCLCSIFHLENFEKLSWDKLWLKANRISYMESILLYIFDIILYLGLSVIIQSYKDSGLEFYDYIKSFLTNVSRNINITDMKLNEIEKLNIPKFETYHQELSPINKQKKEQNNCLKIINVSKNFDELKAVDNFNGELFSNEIFCLLGHNGAGKTTLVNMISGIFDPNFGDILFNGKSLVTNKKYLYENIGLCQQEDIFFDYLTVQEHLEFMCKIKGSKVSRKEIKDLLYRIELTNKKDALCGTLSGGQKRKLCIALALIGRSQIILLDEPTSGMDVMARRKLWEFLKTYKKDKIILLTTHFLDEAEYLGDRIGIMSDGKFLCSGTSSFLKSKYPCGFNLNLLINWEKFNDDIKQEFFEGIKKYDPKSEIRISSKGTFTINIQSNNKNIPEIFDYVEQKKNECGINDYTVSSTSLEDVFLKINNKANINDLKYIKKDIIKIKEENNGEEKEELENNKLLESKLKNMNLNISTSSFFSQLLAQIKRGLYPLTRNKTLFLFELLSGLGFVYIFIFFFSDFIIHATTIKLNLPDILNEHNVYYYEKNQNNNYYVKNSFAFNLKPTIPLTQLNKEPTDITDFMNLSFEQAFVNIAKGGLYIDNSNPELINVYNTEVDTSLNGYFYANTMLFVSSFLKNNYDINAVILPEIEFNALSDNGLKESAWSFFKDFIVLIVVCLISLFGFVIFLGGLMYEKIREKRYNIKHLLYLSGCNIWSYWLGFFIVDYIKLIFYNIFLILPVYYVSGVGIYFGMDMLAISLSSLSFIYFISFFCKKEDEGAKILFIFVFGFLIAITALCIVYSDKLLKYSSSFTELYKLNFMDFTPVTSMGLSFIRIIISFTFWDLADKVANLIKGVFKINLQLNEIHGFYRPKYYLYTSFIAQAVNFVVYSLLLLLAESGLLEKFIHNIQLFFINSGNNYVFSEEKASEEFISNNNLISPLVDNEDKKANKLDNNNIIIKSDSKNKINSSKDPLKNIYVQKEKEKVKSDKDLSTKISGLRKTFFVCCGKNVRAINNLYLGLEPNEKFGLLGFNGSGKTTTFRAITNEILTDSGSINLFGYDNKRQFKYIRTSIGYCPQINPLFDFMKVKEIIQFYLELKTSNESIETICSKFGLLKYLNTYTVNLSGGNKRKLTFAIALMNKPTLLLLDEPSTGVDPESRRFMWKNINELTNSGHKYNMILTTHSMEEAEILCDTVSWLKAGNFICLGNPEQLKIEFSAGYKLHIKFDDKEINKDIKNENIEEIFSNIKELVDGFDIFENIILNNKSVCVENYLNGLIKIVKNIKNMTNKIVISEIGKDMSFELIIEIIKEKQKELFTEILNMKNINKEIDEINISMQSLENILTSLH